jgi:hypothetical protein
MRGRGDDLAAAMRPIANVIGWAQGRMHWDRVFDGLDEEIVTASAEVFSNLPRPHLARPAGLGSPATAGAGGAPGATGAGTTAQPPPSSTNPPPRGGSGSGGRASTTIQVPAVSAWTATGIVLPPGAAIEIEASGTVEAAAASDGRPFYHQVPPTGRGELQSHLPQPLLHALSLLGRIGNGPVVPIGLGVKMLAAPPYGSGELFLGINDDVVADNSGAWTVRITFLIGAPASSTGSSGGDRGLPPPPPPPPPPVDTGEWTQWINRDDGGGAADWEALAEMRASIPCAAPTAIECRVVGGADWRQAGQRYQCSLDGPNPGGICINADNPGGCLNYEVRYRCPASTRQSQFSRVEPASGGQWTGWLNRDNPLDSADWEGLSEFGGAVPCAMPIAIECRTTDGRDWSAAGQRYTCSLEGPNPGGICVNSENPGGCLDYEVRFRCP